MAERPNFKGLGARVFGQGKAEAPTHPVDTFLNEADIPRIVLLPIDSILPNPDQPRRYFDPKALEDLTNSVRERGVLQPVIARKNPVGEGYLLIAGERRWRASRAAGLEKIPTLVREKDDPAELALIENIQREDLSPLEEAEGLLRLKESRGFSDEALAAVIGKSRVTVNELLSLNKLPEQIKDACRTSDSLTKSQLLTLARAGSPRKVQTLWNEFRLGRTRTVKELRQKVRAAKGKPENYRYNHAASDGRYRVSVSFSKPNVEASEVAEALNEALKSLG